MMQSAAYGRLGQEPKSITTQSGNAMAVCSMAVSIGDHDDAPLWVGIVCFGKVAEDLLRHQKGDMVSVSGRVQRSSWTSSSGEKKEQLQIVADSLLSSRSVRPNNGSHRRSQERRGHDDYRDQQYA